MASSSEQQVELEKENVAVQDNDEDERLPWKQVIPLVLLQVAESFNSSSIFSYVAFLVQDLTGADRDQAGTWAGLVASAVYLGAFFSSYLWGKLSDKIGKRFCLLLGSAGTFFMCIAFGFSFHIGWAIATRFLGGFLNGNLGVAKSYLGTITNSKNQARAFGLISIAWGTGSMIGSSIGGFTARPAVNWPSVFDPEGFFGKFPYILPNMINAFVVATAWTGAFFFLPEPPPKPTRISSDEAGEELIPVHQQKLPMYACMSYMLIGFCFILFEELMPLWLTSTIVSGGLNFSPPQIGIFTSVFGAFLLVIQLFIYPHIANKIGFLYAHRCGLLLMIPLILCTPLANLLWRNSVAQWAVLLTIGFGFALADSLGFCVIVMINNSVKPSQFGEVNGIGQTGVSLVRAIGPALGGVVFAWSLTPGHRYPFNHWFVFLVQALLFFGMFGFSFLLHRSLNKPYFSEDIPYDETSAGEVVPLYPDEEKEKK